ncbi:family 20 glycosylhydrolase [Flavihumibacter profundi]|uniref:family 20 glycosylhydrolase n=1 Tax=Flavihumibacter profundi TaxID=2716883 RepID=UPI001CC4C146|nr:family 20 glycosylhydrolase [Flavihumibacter profundi]MBZ5855620.1 beta-N-acetylhexosaminidase [Flavihumibacter profundi]
MKIKFQFFLALKLICFVCSSGYAAQLPYPFKILPQPQKVDLLNGKGLKPGNLVSILLKGDSKLPVIGTLLSQLPVGKSAGKGTVALILNKTIASLPSEEGYILAITRDRIEITAKGEAGLFYGCQSLEQLLEDARDNNIPLPSCSITDFPALSYRAVHFDVKHHLDHMNYYYESIDRLARYKINAIVFEFEDKLRYQLQPLVGAPQSISLDEMSALTKYARERYIEITPLVQGLGHATFILKHEQYAGLRELPWNHWAFCPLNEGTYQVLFDLYRDAIKATPGSKYLHIGGDEIGNIGLCPRCKPTADKEGMMSLNLYWLKRVCEFAKENNRIPIFWDDMPLQHAGLYKTTWSDEVTAAEATEAWKKGIATLDSLQQDFPKNCVYMRWNYSMARQPGNILALDWYRQHKLQAMVATATNAEGGMLFQADERNKGAASSGIVSIRSFIQMAAEKNISGMLCTAWDDKSPHMENYWRGFIAAAEYSWSPNGRSLEGFDEAWLQREFGLSLPGYTTLNEQLRAGSLLWYEALYKKGSLFDDENALQSMKQVEHWLPPSEGQENKQFDYTSKLIELPDKKSPGLWSEKYSDKLSRAESALKNYPELSQKLEDLQNNSRRNKYYWKLAGSLYKFQTETPRLLIALKHYDSKDLAEHNAGIAEVKKALIASHLAWTELEEVYTQTRFIANPANYLPDRYFHLASQREDLTWMIQAQELYERMIVNNLQ